MKWLILSLAILLSTSCKGQTISADSAANYVGKEITVTGTVSGEYFDHHAKGEPTFLDIDGSYPDQAFTIVIWKEDRDKFKYLLESIEGKNIAIKGKVTLYRGKPEMEVTNPGQINKR
ncbi:MAG: DNA-binding protein [Chitinophagaceae bacterium]|nr:MAG: DNA-binding protein [Chitinophagaceae bacterium]